MGLLVEGRIPVRDGAELTTIDGEQIGRVSSGGFSPSLGAPIALAFVAKNCAVPGQKLMAIVRNKSIPVELCALPFVTQRYYRIKQ